MERFKRIISTFLLLIMVWAPTMAQTSEVEKGIINRTQCGGFWRYDFNYQTVDADGETPIVLSAAIFLSNAVHNKTVKAKGCGLLNHYTITDNTQRPTNVTSGFTLEGVFANSNYIIIESDGFGFGLDVENSQKYLQGRATARVNIDALLAGRKLIAEEGFEFGDAILNLGYSQGGNSGMWVNRLVAEGYRSDELPKIDFCIIGGGPYDMYTHYRKLADENLTQYPVALPLILSGMIDAGENRVKNEDVFNEDFVQYLPELFDSKTHDTDYINRFIYEKYGDPNSKTMAIDKIMKPEFFDENNEGTAVIVELLKENSLVYADWKPEKTDSIYFVHSEIDEVVPVINQQNMEQHLMDHGYRSFKIDYTNNAGHTNTGMVYVMRAIGALSGFVPTKIEAPFSDAPQENTHAIYSIDGRLVKKNITLSEAYRTLPKGIYIINGRKVVKR